jgi:hypothetical protein
MNVSFTFLDWAVATMTMLGVGKIIVWEIEEIIKKGKS